MQKLLETRIEVEKKMVEEVAGDLTLYLMSKDHFIITSKMVPAFEEESILRAGVKAVSQGDKYAFILPSKIYRFYRLDENEYTVMVSEKDPKILVVTI